MSRLDQRRRSTFLRPLTKSGESSVISSPPKRMASTASTPIMQLESKDQRRPGVRGPGAGGRRHVRVVLVGNLVAVGPESSSGPDGKVVLERRQEHLELALTDERRRGVAVVLSRVSGRSREMRGGRTNLRWYVETISSVGCSRPVLMSPWIESRRRFSSSTGFCLDCETSSMSDQSA